MSGGVASEFPNLIFQHCIDLYLSHTLVECDNTVADPAREEGGGGSKNNFKMKLSMWRSVSKASLYTVGARGRGLAPTKGPQKF